MQEFCRLCAVLRHPEEFKCKIDDIDFDIERKLVSFCNWNSYRSHQNLPKGVCIPCFLQLEQCCYFLDAVSRAQQRLCQLMKVDLYPKSERDTDDELQSFDNAGDDMPDFQVKVENAIDDSIEIGPIEVSALKLENEDEVYAHDYDNINENYEYAEYISEDLSTVENFSEVYKVQKAASTKQKPQKRKTTCKNPRKNSKPSTKKYNIKKVDFDIKSLLMHEDVNDNGTIKPEKIIDLNFCNWTVVQHLCGLCNMEFSTHSDLWVHFTTNHSNEKLKFVCPICPESMTFLSGRYFREHIASTHYPHLTFCCHRCQKFFHDKKKMKEHLRSHPKDPSVSVCPTCGKGFSYYKNLHFHMLSHLPTHLQPQFECYLCKKLLKSSQSLQKHIKYHVGVFKSAICDQCGKAFVTPYKLKKHMSTHSDERPWACETCGKTFKTSSILRRHARIHQDFKKYACDICGHRTLDKSGLKLHTIRYHSDLNPFPCDVCGKKFYSARTMNTHKKNMHIENRPFACNLCDHRTINEKALRRHHKHVHLDHRPHECPACDYRTYSKYNLGLHTSRRHPELGQMSQDVQQLQCE